MSVLQLHICIVFLSVRLSLWQIIVFIAVSALSILYVLMALAWFLRSSKVFKPSCCIIRVGLHLPERLDWLCGVLQSVSFIRDGAAHLLKSEWCFGTVVHVFLSTWYPFESSQHCKNHYPVGCMVCNRVGL